ncbi:hypothetical protein NDU88_002034, partial [Pleurodeles waltl]
VWGGVCGDECGGVWCFVRRCSVGDDVGFLCVLWFAFPVLSLCVLRLVSEFR